jgi:hypothetical protein
VSEAEEPVDVEIERPHVHHRSGHRWIDLIVPVAALFVSFVSILIAYHHGQVMKELVEQNAKLVQANSLPYLELGFSNGTPTGGVRRKFMATNSGVGPAKIESVEIQVDGRPVINPDELLSACCGGPINTRLLTSTLLGRMVRAGDTITYLDLGEASETDQARQLMRAYNRGRVVVTACYCSVFDECWTQSSRAMQPKPVKVCPMPKRQYSH